MNKFYKKNVYLQGLKIKRYIFPNVKAKISLFIGTKSYFISIKNINYVKLL